MNFFAILAAVGLLALAGLGGLTLGRLEELWRKEIREREREARRRRDELRL